MNFIAMDFYINYIYDYFFGQFFLVLRYRLKMLSLESNNLLPQILV